MPEQVQKILTKITDWWKKFTTKQRILLGSIVAVIILALVILAVVVGKPNMVTLIECSSTAQAGEVKDLLDNDGSISYQMSDDGLTFYVDEKDNAAASILLGQNGVPTEGFSIDNVFSGGFSSTEADKTKKYKLYLENYFADQLETLSNVESASVTLDIPNDDYHVCHMTLNEDMSELTFYSCYSSSTQRPDFEAIDTFLQTEAVGAADSIYTDLKPHKYSALRFADGFRKMPPKRKSSGG